MRILHVEDDDDTRTLVAFVLEGEGWQIISVDNANTAIELAADRGFDLYLIDNWINGQTENALWRDLRSLDPGTPILYYSGAAFPADVETSIESGPLGYLQKPADPEALVEAIMNLTSG